MKTGAIPEYFDAMLNAQAPDRFSYKFLEGLGFSSSNDRLLIGILKDIGFLNADGAPTDRYYQFLDKSKSAQIVAEGIREAYSDLFSVSTTAQKLNADEAYNKLRSLYRGEKKDSVVKLIAKTFVAMCEYGDFDSSPPRTIPDPISEKTKASKPPIEELGEGSEKGRGAIEVKSLQYHINIVLPETRDPTVYDAIFKSMRVHLG